MSISALITGANSGLGYAIAENLLNIAEKWPMNDPRTIRICISCRSDEKARSTIDSLCRKRSYGLLKRLQISYILMDLCSMQTIESAAQKLIERDEKFGTVFLNAGASQMERVDYFKATCQALTDPIGAFSEPRFYTEKQNSTTEDGLAFCFQVNVFGHYYFKKRIESILDRDSRVIFSGSIEANMATFSKDDIQGLRCPRPYSRSKYILDALHLSECESLKFNQYVCNPGIFCSNFMSSAVSSMLKPLAILAFYICRLGFGSKLHTVNSDTATTSFLDIALCDEPASPRYKWASTVSRLGHTSVDAEPFNISLDHVEVVGNYCQGLFRQWQRKLSEN